MFRWLIILFCLGLATPALALVHDPTCPPGQSPYVTGNSAGDLKVQAIFIAPNKKTVVIGDRHLTIGDQIMGAKIVAIDAHTVTLQGKRGKFIIEIFRPINKRLVNKNGEKT